VTQLTTSDVMSLSKALGTMQAYSTLITAFQMLRHMLLCLRFVFLYAIYTNDM